MTVKSITINCGNCGKRLKEKQNLPVDKRKPCPKCGSFSRTAHVNIENNISIFGKLKLKGKSPGEKRPFIEEISGDDLHRKSGKWMKLLRLIDRRKNKYVERVTDPKSGEVIHEREEPLSEHRGHGDAKKKKDRS